MPPSFVATDVGYSSSAHGEILSYSSVLVSKEQSINYFGNVGGCKFGVPVGSSRHLASKDVSPGFVTTYYRDGSAANREVFSNVGVHVPDTKSSENFRNLLVGKLGSWAQFSWSMNKNSGSNSIIGIVLSSTGVQMVWIIAGFVVAFMENTKAFRDLTVDGDKSKTVGFDRFSFPSNVPIPVRKYCSGPHPASQLCRVWMRHFAENIAVHRAIFLRSVFRHQRCSAIRTIKSFSSSFHTWMIPCVDSTSQLKRV